MPARLSQLWQAYDDGRQRMIAIKAILPKAAKDSEQVGYLRQEFKVGQEIKHPRIIEVYNFDIDRGTPFLAMEWFPAPNLKKRIRTKEDREKLFPFFPTIVEQAAEGLGWMHGKGWVHRDIKPENFLVNDTGQAKLIDFGLAQRPSGWLAKLLPIKPKIQGTPSYMSPEQIRCGALDQRADVYSFGCVLYELVAGVPPYTGSTQEELFGKHLKSRCRPWRRPTAMLPPILPIWSVAACPKIPRAGRLRPRKSWKRSARCGCTGFSRVVPARPHRKNCRCIGYARIMPGRREWRSVGRMSRRNPIAEDPDGSGK